MNIFTSRFFLILSMVACVLFTGCANNPQLGLRGNPNAPWTNMQYLRVDPNAMMRMSPSQYNEYVRRVETHNRIVAEQLRNDQQAARNAQTWSGDVNRDRYYSIDRTLGRGFDRLLQRGIDNMFR